MLTRRVMIGWGAGLVAAVIWGGGAVVSRALVQTDLDALDLALLRYAGCFPIAVALCLYNPSLSRLGTAWWQTLVLLLLAGPAYHLLLIYGYNFATAGAGALLVTGLLPIFAIVLHAVVYRVAPTPAAQLGAVLVCAGLLAFAARNGTLAGFEATVTIEGLVVFVSAAALWAILNELVRRWKIDPLRLTISLALWSPVFLPVYLAFNAGGLSMVGLPTLALQMVYHGVLVAFVGTGLFFMAIRAIGSEQAAFLQASSPAFASLLGAGILGEQISAIQAGGTLVVIAGIMLAGVPRRNQSARPASTGDAAQPTPVSPGPQ